VQMVTITSGNTTQASFSLIAIFPDITITVVWGSQPPDLDAHLSGPASAGGRFHAFFLNPTPENYVALTARDDDGFGPEQIAIRRLQSTGQFVPGDYHLSLDKERPRRKRVAGELDGVACWRYANPTSMGDPEAVSACRVPDPGPSEG
jgi:hypothetical protein